MPDHQPLAWKRESLRSEKDFHIFKTRSWNVLDPRDGTPYVRTVIDAPDWVNVVAMTNTDALVLVRQFRFGTWSNSLEIPGGMLDGGEDPATAGARELEEETGYRAGKMTLIGVSHPNPAIFSNRLHSYLAEGCVKVHDGRPDASEDLQVVVVPRADVMPMVHGGQITHSLVLAALLYAGTQSFQSLTRP